MSIDYASIGDRIRYIRTQKGMSQEELAEFADVSPVYISNVERGEKSVSLKVIIAIANALNVTADTLLIDSITALSEKRNGQEFSVLYDCSKEENDILLRCMSALKSILREYTLTK